MLVDAEIADLAKAGMVTPFDPICLNPHSLDIRLGTRILEEVQYTHATLIHLVRWQNRFWRERSIEDRTKEDPFWLEPGMFLLGHSFEIFTLPTTIGGTFYLKSSRAREGYGHSLAGHIDAGWTNSALTLELFSHSRYYALPLYPGLRIGQVVFYRLGREPDFSYRETGHYNGDLSVQTSKDGNAA